jgi:hypothetical protein
MDGVITGCLGSWLTCATGEPQALPSTPRDEPEEGSGAYRPYPYRQPVPQEQRGRVSREHQVGTFVGAYLPNSLGF